MSFFNKKEDVIDIQLTQHGKHLLSKGKFKPAYYAFFDDDIIYDSSYAGVTEIQNDIQQRIEDTPRLKAQYNFSGRSAGDIPDILPAAERSFSLTSALGTSGIGSSNAPAWQVAFFKGAIKSFTNTYTDENEEQQPLEIPQVELEDVEYITQVFKGQPGIETLDAITGENLSAIDDNFNIIFPDGSYVSTKEDYALIKVEELSVDFERENFDIEVFKIESDASLTPLKFAKRPEIIKDGILLDPSEESGGAIPELDETFVEYWFNIFCDSEIDEKYLCDLDSGTPQAGIFVQENPYCVDKVETTIQATTAPISEEEDEC